MGKPAGALAQFPEPLGAELAARRTEPRQLPLAAGALRRGLAHRPGLQLLRFPGGRDAGRRHWPIQYSSRRRRDREPRLLDRRACRAPAPYERRPAAGARFRLRPPAPASGGGGLPAEQRAEPRSVIAHRLPAGGLCPQLPADRRQMAGPFAVRDPARGLARVIFNLTAGAASSRRGASAFRQAWPASVDSIVRSIPSLASARCHLPSLSWLNTRSPSASTDSQPFACISASS